MPAVDLLRAMLLIRRFEQRLQARPDRGFQLFSSGAEAAAVGLCAVLGPQDQLLCSGRSIGPALARGLEPGAVMAELLGKAAGPCHGHAGRGHMAQPDAGFFGAHAVVGGNLSIAAGVALAMQVAARPGLVACIFGDGACAAGALHETMNIAALWRLPLLLVCDNNGYAISTPRAAGLAPARLADLGQAFGMPAETVDGMDVLAVQQAAGRLVAGIRAGGGPALLECLTARFTPHSTGTRETRPAAELAALRAACPIQRLGGALLATGRLDPAGLAALEQEAEARVSDALAVADAARFPLPAEAMGHVG